MINFLLKLFYKRMDQIKLGRGMTIKGITKPSWTDPKTNILWAIWLFISSFNYFKQALFLKTSHYHGKRWFKVISYTFTTLLLPLTQVLRLVKWLRFTRFILLAISMLISLIYSPQDILFILAHFITLTIANADVLLSLFQKQVTNWVTNLSLPHKRERETRWCETLSLLLPP